MVLSFEDFPSPDDFEDASDYSTKMFMATLRFLKKKGCCEENSPRWIEAISMVFAQLIYQMVPQDLWEDVISDAEALVWRYIRLSKEEDESDEPR